MRRDTDTVAGAITVDGACCRTWRGRGGWLCSGRGHCGDERPWIRRRERSLPLHIPLPMQYPTRTTPGVSNQPISLPCRHQGPGSHRLLPRGHVCGVYTRSHGDPIIAPVWRHLLGDSFEQLFELNNHAPGISSGISRWTESSLIHGSPDAAIPYGNVYYGLKSIQCKLHYRSDTSWHLPLFATGRRYLPRTRLIRPRVPIKQRIALSRRPGDSIRRLRALILAVRDVDA